MWAENYSTAPKDKNQLVPHKYKNDKKKTNNSAFIYPKENIYQKAIYLDRLESTF